MAAQAVIQPPIDPALQQTPFWTDQDHMALSVVSRRRLVTDGFFYQRFRLFQSERIERSFQEHPDNSPCTTRNPSSGRWKW